MLGIEVLIVLWLSLGAAAIRSMLGFINRISSEAPLSDQTVSLVTPFTPDRAWLDVAYHVSGIVIALGAVALVWYLLKTSGEGMASIGVDLTQPRRDLARGVVLAALIGGAGLVLYLVAVQLGINAQVAPSTIGERWYELPVLLLRAAEAAAVEEIVVLGYVLHRLSQIGVNMWWAVTISATLRATYHLYQGVGGFIGNLIMGVIFGLLFMRWKRASPMIVAHFLIDAVAFIGFALLADRLGWLPG
ncbi:MAG: CPBP family intramembrane metalloprotease [Actinobacteria bacterium]|nr:CPBP family intramembrane metalloprotease [Actinomycetota bacterium]